PTGRPGRLPAPPPPPDRTSAPRARPRPSRPPCQCSYPPLDGARGRGGRGRRRHLSRMRDNAPVSQVPAARRALAVLRLLASAPGPLPASAIARTLGLPRSSTYHLLAAMAEEGFVTPIPEERRWGLGVAAFEIGSAYLRHEPLERLARPLLRRLVDRVGEIAQLGVLHGAETLYLLKEQPPGHATLVTDVGVRMPAHLTASGRSMLAHLPPAQVRALFPGRFVSRTGRGPASLRELRRVLAEDARRGWAVEDGHVTEGFASIA